MSVASLWAATAVPAPDCPALDGDATADVAIVGAGFTGLSAALHIAGDGRRPIVLDAHTVGFGASGRNGGLASGKFRVSFQQVMAQHGRAAAHRLHALGQEAVDCVEGLIDRYSLPAVGFSRCGYLTAAHTPQAMAYLRSAAEWLSTEVGDQATHLLDREATARELGTRQYFGGSLNTRAAALHPLNYVRGLAGAAHGLGVAIHEQTPVTAVRRERTGFRVETPTGTVQARQVIFTTNAYSDLTGATAALRRRVIPFRSAIIATAPLGAELGASVLPTGRVVADTKRLLRWYRKAGDRFIFGGRGAFGRADSEASFATLERQMKELFPQLSDQPLEFRWSGLVAMTMDFAPHVGSLEPGLFHAVGFNGSGVAITSLMGKALAAVTRGEAPDLSIIGRAPFPAIPFYPLVTPGVRLATAWHQALDALGR